MERRGSESFGKDGRCSVGEPEWFKTVWVFLGYRSDKNMRTHMGHGVSKKD